ncbi:MAG: hypothetical protein ACI4WU_00330 [Bacilli bacterium]
MSNKFFKGIIGSILGAIIFSIPWILIYVYANYILSILAAIIAYGSLLFYKKFGGEITKKTGVVITISSLLAITLATFVIIPLCLIAKEGYGLSFEYYQILFASGDFVSAIMQDYIISVIFTFLGISGVIASINKEAYRINKDGQDDNENIAYAPFEEQVKYLESVYAKYDAFSKEKAIPSSILLGELNIKNKLKLIKDMESKGIIVSPFNKSYFDKSAVEDKNIAKKNRRKNILLPTFTGIIIGIIALLIIFIAIGSTEGESTSNNNNNQEEVINNQEFTYQNIKITLPNTFRKDEETDDYISYLNYSYDDPVYEIMLQQYDFKDTNIQTSEEYQNSYLAYLKESFDIKSTEDITIDSKKGFEIKMFSLEYPEEYYISYVVFDDDYVYIIMYFTAFDEDVKDYDTHLSNFETNVSKYQKTITFTKENPNIITG